MKHQNRFIKNKEFLVLISKCQKKLRTSAINNCNKEHIYSIIECVLNVLNGNVNIDSETYNKLKPFNKVFTKLVDRKTNLKTKRKLIIQKGGFLQFLIPAIVSGLATIISSAISRNTNNE